MRDFWLVGGLSLLLLTLPSNLTAKNSREALSKSRGDGEGKGRLLSLFSIVTFANTGCQSQSGTTGLGTNRNGTCYTSTECSDKGGTASGNCAAGFGVCCLFILNTATSLTASENCTYIQNPGFPTAYSSATSLTYTINKCATDVCYLRVDFETFNLLGPAATLEADNGHNCQDTFLLSGSGGTLSSINVLCGLNTGQHVYTDMGRDATGTATISMSFTGTVTTRTWEFKLTQIECSNLARPPTGCFQYHTGLTGRLTTFNFDQSAAASQQHLATQLYSICIRPETGYCCVKYTLCTDDNSWTIDHNQATVANQDTEVDTECTEDYLGISGISGSCSLGTSADLHSRICGAKFGLFSGSKIAMESLCDCTQPFSVDVVTNAAQDDQPPSAIVGTSRGACLNYQQVSCSSLT